jgi:hypothetical protein
MEYCQIAELIYLISRLKVVGRTQPFNCIELENKMKRIFASVLTLALLVGLGLAPNSRALGTPKSQQVISWSWEDGADKKHRDFSEDDYDSVLDMPALKITALPNTVSRRVIVEYFDDNSGEWLTETTARTGSDGSVKVQLNPLCQVGIGFAPAWCDHDVTYRVRVLRSGTQKNMTSSSFVVSYMASIDGNF